VSDVPPSPLEWDPAYDSQRPWLLDWLNSRGPYAGRDTLLAPRPPLRPPFRVGPLPDLFRLTRQRAAGRAPYVGDPFHYEWWVARDELGRSIAGDTRIVRG